MKKILTLNSKGGVGKSTFTVLLSIALSRAGLRDKVAVLDLDSQGSSRESIGRFAHEGVKIYDENGPEPMLLVIDTEGKSAFEKLLEVAPEADIYIVPTSPSGEEIRIAGKTVTYLKKLRPKAKVLILFTKVDERAKDSDSEVLKAFAAEIGAPALSHVIHHRKAYDYALSQGWNVLKPADRLEWSKVATEILANL